MSLPRFLLSAVLALAMISFPAAAQTAGYDNIVPHLAVGGGYTSLLDLSDPIGVEPRQVDISFFGDNGKPLPVRVDGGAPVASKSLTLTRFQEIRIVLTADGQEVRQGWVRIACDRGAKLYVALRFLFGSDILRPQDAVGMVPSGVQRTWYVPAGKHGAEEYTGVAVVNPNEHSVDVEFNYYQGPLRVAGTTAVPRTLPPLGHLALFTHELFPVNFAGDATLEVYGLQGNLAVAALRGDSTQFSSLPANAAVELWNFEVRDAAGGLIEQGTWCWKYNESTGFHGVASIGAQRVDLRGSFTGTRFELARFAGAGEGPGADLYVYQGTLETQGTVTRLRGSRLEIGAAGSVLRTSTFNATRQP